jgi:hypothetical protein
MNPIQRSGIPIEPSLPPLAFHIANLLFRLRIQVRLGERNDEDKGW